MPGFRKKIPRYTDPEQVAKLKAASRFNATLMDELRPHVREGTTTDQLDKLAYQYTMDHGHTPACLGYLGYPKTICTSVNEVICHGIPNDRPLEAGDIVSVDIGGKLNGWCGDAACTYAVGQLAPEAEKLLNVTRETLELAVELMKKKSMWSEVAREMGSYVYDHGFSVVECFVGHGIGRQLHEEPQVPNFLSRSLRGAGDFRIEPGLVMAVEPMVNMGSKSVKMAPDYWTQMTVDGLLSAHFEHTIAVRHDGPFLLTQAPRSEEAAEPVG